MSRMMLFAFALMMAIWNKAWADEAVHIGFLAPMSGPQSVVGKEVLDGFRLGLKAAGNSMSGKSIDLIVSDDQGQPDVGRQAVVKMLQHDHASLIVIGSFSNILLAVTQPVFSSNKILFSVNPGSSLLAGKGCDPRFFVTSFQVDGMPEAVGKYMDSRFKTAFFLAPNYQGGRDTGEGFKRYYKQKIVGEVYSPFNQLDFAAEIAQIREVNPEAVYFFYPGSLGVNFLKQWDQSGPKNVKLLTHLSLDQTLMPAVKDAAVGIYVGTMWSEQLDNPENVTFVDNFRKEYGRIPTAFAANAYDGARMVVAAVNSIGDVSDTAALEQAIKTVPFKSVRGPFRFNTNHFPIQNYFMTEVVKNADGSYGFAIRDEVFKDHGDAYAEECHMPQ